MRKDERKFRSREVPGLEGPVEAFLAGRRVDAAGFGVAGPVRDGRCEATNLPWVVDAALLAGQLALSCVALVNDLFANALGLSELSGEDFAVVNAGTPDREGNAALISAGTGLGEAYLVRSGGRLVPQASEGGHASFAPRNPFEIDLLRHLHRTDSHVSFERVLSGPGLAALYAFERSRSQESEPAWLSAEIAAAGDASPAVTAAGLSGEGSRGRAHPRALRLDLRRRGRKPRAQGPRDGRRLRGRRDRSQDPAEAPRRDVLRGLLRQGALRGAPREDSDTVVTNDRCALLGAARAGAEAAS